MYACVCVGRTEESMETVISLLFLGGRRRMYVDLYEWVVTARECVGRSSVTGWGTEL